MPLLRKRLLRSGAELALATGVAPRPANTPRFGKHGPRSETEEQLRQFARAARMQ